ncbi:F-box protein CPR30-like [Chenopodium quinoa]|uniref:F-box protein CPR30-like n=1 Tax=Chenopodium quinoa TaxID=63459 RepID=UPI000B76C02A|nr:F-box protein CPR30-like [Chenopodium quinoa]XP_021753394.1 F-box protein CPR30-like [Chenopodium quinoa]XP_021753395.1 F-box protein CPR30-like [Chenopodium quinoa]XP_021753396.1 F-box protein CPR30-like [Chenopodium quinoa]XP_021753398.1 F-box protein CPR30-like [Chenopodium quinoa]XP_021753399.1 F-box protein CPR30-like [Chenopodium quinoa]
MAEFPTEIITEILSRLPVNSLLRFKSVCKFWNSLIKSPNFIKTHLNQTLISNFDRYLLKSSADSSFFISKLDLHNNQFSFSGLDHPLEYEEVELFGSCNGVICISDYAIIDVFLFNPLTKSYRKLPVKRIPNPERDFVLFGFGYDSKNDDYKVLRILQGYSYRKCCYDEVQLYSLNNKSWKSVQGIPHPYYLPFADCHGVLVNEVLHYIVSSDELELQQCKMIAGFDLRTESFSLIDCPIHDEKTKTYWDFLEFHLRELGGCLSVVVAYLTRDYACMMPILHNRELERADLWIMKEYGNNESWVKLFSVCKLPNIRRFVGFTPVVYSKDGRQILIVMDCLEAGWYDLESGKFEKVTVRGLPDTYFDTGYFVGSLVSLEFKPQPSEIVKRKNKNNKVSDTFLAKGFKLKL